MKTCKICERSLPETDFYKRNENKDGLDDYCKPCRLEMNREVRRKKGAPTMPRSTADGMAYLMSKGIPVVPGGKVGFANEDIAAFGDIVIEVKGSFGRQKDNKHFMWGWTKAQKAKEKRGYVMLIAYRDPEEPRYFIIPANHPIFTETGQKLCVSFDTHHWSNGKRWDLVLAEYENAHRQIFEELRNRLIKADTSGIFV